VNIFGQARINLAMLHPGSLKIVHTLPALFVIGSIAIVLLSIFISPCLLLLPVVYIVILFVDALLTTQSLSIAGLSILTSMIQLFGYGLGFIRSFIEKIILRRGMEDVETLKKVYK
jgi:hypothetical protein